jgi:Predicted HD superfamily hydrolase
MDSYLIDNTIKYISCLFEDNADGHDYNHSIRVWKNAMKIVESYPEADTMIIALAALLHDADDYKLFDTKNNQNTRDYLKNQNISNDYIDRICEVINTVSFSKNKGIIPNTIEGCIVRDADRLDALGAIGIARTFAYGGSHGRSIEESISHFYDKLLLLKDQMITEEAKKMAEDRHMFIEQFINELNNELIGLVGGK